MLKRLLNNAKPSPSAPKNTHKTKHQPVKTNYSSLPVAIPPDFLTSPPTTPVTITPIDFSTTPLPEYAGRYAVVLDNVLSPSECATLIQLAESSVVPTARGEDGSAWSPAMVNVGAGFEVLTPHYRHSDRIIWDNLALVDRLWARCLGAPGLGERMAMIEGEEGITGRGRRAGLPPPRMRFARVNERMRFLKYGKGQFFRREFFFFLQMRLRVETDVMCNSSHGCPVRGDGGRKGVRDAVYDPAVSERLPGRSGRGRRADRGLDAVSVPG